MKMNQINPKSFQGEFRLTPIKDEIFASAMDCSKMLIEDLRNLTGKISILQKKDFVGNIDCRYCGQHYENEIWIGLYFNNFLFTSAYQLTIAIKDSDGSVAQKLSGYTFYFTSHFFAPEEINGRWVFIKLDNRLLDCNESKAIQEIELVLTEILDAIK